MTRGRHTSYLVTKELKLAFSKTMQHIRFEYTSKEIPYNAEFKTLVSITHKYNKVGYDQRMDNVLGSAVWRYKYYWCILVTHMGLLQQSL